MKQTNTIRVIVKSCSDKDYWWFNLIGQELEVEDYNEVFYIMPNQKVIYKSDCEIVPPFLSKEEAMKQPEIAAKAPCPITGNPFFMSLDHPRGYVVDTYGGSFDSYTIPEKNEDGDYDVEHYCHDGGGWDSISFDIDAINQMRRSNKLPPIVSPPSVEPRKGEQSLKWENLKGQRRSIRCFNAEEASKVCAILDINNDYSDSLCYIRTDDVVMGSRFTNFVFVFNYGYTPINDIDFLRANRPTQDRSVCDKCHRTVNQLKMEGCMDVNCPKGFLAQDREAEDFASPLLYPIGADAEGAMEIAKAIVWDSFSDSISDIDRERITTKWYERISSHAREEVKEAIVLEREFMEWAISQLRWSYNYDKKYWLNLSTLERIATSDLFTLFMEFKSGKSNG